MHERRDQVRVRDEKPDEAFFERFKATHNGVWYKIRKAEEEHKRKGHKGRLSFFGHSFRRSTDLRHKIREDSEDRKRRREQETIVEEMEKNFQRTPKMMSFFCCTSTYTDLRQKLNEEMKKDAEEKSKIDAVCNEPGPVFEDDIAVEQEASTAVESNTISTTAEMPPSSEQTKEDTSTSERPPRKMPRQEQQQESASTKVEWNIKKGKDASSTSRRSRKEATDKSTSRRQTKSRGTSSSACRTERGRTKLRSSSSKAESRRPISSAPHTQTKKAPLGKEETQSEDEKRPTKPIKKSKQPQRKMKSKGKAPPSKEDSTSGSSSDSSSSSSSSSESSSESEQECEEKGGKRKRSQNNTKEKRRKTDTDLNNNSKGMISIEDCGELLKSLARTISEEMASIFRSQK